MIAVGLKVLAGTLFWEAQFQVFQWLFSAMPAKTPHERLFKKCAPSYIVSYVHAFFLAWAGWRIVLTLEGADIADRAWLYASGDVRFVGFVELATMAFFTYVMYDMFHLILQFPDLGGADMFAHHVGFLVAAAGAYAYGAYPLMLGWLCTCETSTPFLSTRYFIRAMKDIEYTQPLLDNVARAFGMKSRGQVAAHRMEYVVASMFFVTFVLVRCVGYAWALIGLAKVCWFGKAAVNANIPVVVRHGLSFLCVSGFLLNLMWLNKLIGMLTSEKKRKWLRKDAEQ